MSSLSFLSSSLQRNIIFSVTLFLLCYISNVEAVTNCTFANDCFYATGKPYCVEGVCRECNPLRNLKDCDCPANHYCVSDPFDKKRGSCRELEEEIIGRQCRGDLKGQDWISLLRGSNDSLFCGLVTYNSNLTARTLEWEGSCQMGVCEICASALVPTVPFAYCNDGRVCVNKKFRYAIAGIFSWSYFFYNPLVFSFYLVVLLVIFAIVFILVGLSSITYYLKLAYELNKKRLGGERDPMMYEMQ